ncbi:MAG: glycosyltransferase [Deltaproteobacteria bacterium]|nr:glycosyltransferase [Deltaproteobacteria bacterium]
MHILIEGPSWMGMWSELVSHALSALGHRTCLHYHNTKPMSFRFQRLSRIAGGSAPDLAEWSNRRLLELAAQGPVDVLFSIQGKIDEATAARIRRMHKNVKIVYWFGDVVFDRARERIRQAYGYVDLLLLSYKGEVDRFSEELGSRVEYMPFGVSEAFHRIAPLTPGERARYGAKVAFVGTHYPERDVLLTHLAEDQGLPVSVWGRSWGRSKTLRCRGRLDMARTLKVHQAADVSLNIHHHLSHNGFNMKFYEIPAAGGFEICDFKPAIEEDGFSGLVETYRTADELADKIRYYLKNENARREMAKKFQAHVFAHCTYEARLAGLLSRLEKMPALRAA